MNEQEYTGATMVMAEGAHVGFISCRKCGAALILDSRDYVDVTEIHNEWHEQNDNE